MFERNNFPEQKGFTLIEVLLSITIFSVLTFVMLQFFNQALDFTNKNENKTIGIYVARGMADYMEQQSYQKIKTSYLSDKETASITKKSCQDIDENGENVLTQTEIPPGKTVSACEIKFSPNFNSKQFTVTVAINKFNQDHLNNASIENTTGNLAAMKDSLIPFTVFVNWDNKETKLVGYIAK